MPSSAERKKAAARNEVYLTLRLPADLYDDLCRLAREHLRTASSEARLAIYQYAINHAREEK